MLPYPNCRGPRTDRLNRRPQNRIAEWQALSSLEAVFTSCHSEEDRRTVGTVNCTPSGCWPRPTKISSASAGNRYNLLRWPERSARLASEAGTAAAC